MKKQLMMVGLLMGAVAMLSACVDDEQLDRCSAHCERINECMVQDATFLEECLDGCERNPQTYDESILVCLDEESCDGFLACLNGEGDGDSDLQEPDGDWDLNDIMNGSEAE